MTLKEIRELLATGKPVQWSDEFHLWKDMPEDEHWSFSYPKHRYRTKPEPKLRPWRPEEVPVGAMTRTVDGKTAISLIVAARRRGVLLGGGASEYEYALLLQMREHSTDGGKTWLPCGVQATE